MIKTMIRSHTCLQGFFPLHILNPIAEDPHAYHDVVAEPFVRSDEVPLITTPTKPDTKDFLGVVIKETSSDLTNGSVATSS